MSERFNLIGQTDQRFCYEILPKFARFIHNKVINHYYLNPFAKDFEDDVYCGCDCNLNAVILNTLHFSDMTAYIEIYFGDALIGRYELYDDNDRCISINLPLYLIDGAIRVLTWSAVQCAHNSPIVADFETVNVDRDYILEERNKQQSIRILKNWLLCHRGQFVIAADRDARTLSSRWVHPDDLLLSLAFHQSCKC